MNESRRLANKKYHAKNLDLLRQKSREHMRRKRLDPVFRVTQVQKTREWRERIRQEVFDVYGGAVCKCCGETQRFFLQLDHINGDGTKHRKLLNIKSRGSNMTIFFDLKRKGYPPGYQVLCANCNMGRFRNGGVCPHQTK